jgi:NhaP-type Na+/H+ or K+/H+ antiporter
MEFALFTIVAIVTLVAVEAVFRQLGVATPLVLIVVGIAYSYIPGVPFIHVPSEWIIVGVLPPLLYAAAINVSLVDFRRNLSTIFSLSVLLVIVTAVVVGYLLYFLFPSLSFPAAIALGAVISPTDAVAATSIAKKLGLPRGLITILEGESLVNDATALVLLKTAIAAVAVSATEFQFQTTITEFGSSVILAALLGNVTGIVTVFVRSRLRDPILDTAISLIVPFLAYMSAELLNASGVLSVVIAGLYTAQNGAKSFGAQARITGRMNWRTIQFVLENGVFLLMGLELSWIISEVIDVTSDVGVTEAVMYGLLITAVLIVLRSVFMVPVVFLLRRRVKRAAGLGEMIERGMPILQARLAHNRHTRHREWLVRRYERKKSDLEFLRAEGLGWRGGMILSWAGMRGVVTVAAAQSLPEETPYRAQLVLIAFTVAAATIIVQGGTLPLLIHLTGVRGTNIQADRREFASLLDELTDAALEALEDPRREPPNDKMIDPKVVERARTETFMRRESAWERANTYDKPHTTVTESPHAQYRMLRKRVIAAEREVLLEARSRGSYSPRILTRGQAMLDAEESRLDAVDEG